MTAPDGNVGQLHTTSGNHLRPGREWKLRPAPEALADAIARRLECPAAIARVLAVRGLTPTDLPTFFRPRLEDLHAPEQLLGVPQAVARIRKAVAAREPILIYGDYDVDGTTATVLLKTAIDRVAARGEPSLVSWHVPHRIREGYGMRSERLAEAAAAGIRLVISVDTGVRAFAAAAEARALGLDLIVTDHHLPDGVAGVPEALAVINPAQPGCPYPYKDLCGAAVAFKLAHALLSTHAREQADPVAAESALNSKLLPSLLKLVAIATIADAVPLTGENRTIASLGLRELANPVQPGLRALMEVAALSVDEAPSARDVGFRLGPRINAAGRMDIADDVIELFLTRSPARALELASKLDRLNEERRATERAALLAIEEHLLTLADAAGVFPPECLVLDHPAWHRGVLGILASRVVERTGRPALVLTHEGELCHGSGRSVAGFHLLDALTAAHSHADESFPAGTLLARFGGHAHAVGLSLPGTALPALRRRLRTAGAGLLTDEVLRPPLRYDAELAPANLTFELASWLERAEPFGQGNAEPRFRLRGGRLLTPARLLKDKHLCLEIEPASGGPSLRAMGWSRPSRDWAATLREYRLDTGCEIDLIGRVRAQSSTWFTGLEIDMDDLRPACVEQS